MAKANPCRFSTKYQDDETDLLYYGYRYYNASIGRWISRERLGDEALLRPLIADAEQKGDLEKAEKLRSESIGPNHVFVQNSPVIGADVLGLGSTDLPITAGFFGGGSLKNITITVPKCTILFVYGHNFVGNKTKPGVQWITNISGQNPTLNVCSRAAVGACSANRVPNSIPLEGFNYSDYDVADEGTISVPTLLQMWNDVRNKYAAQAAATIKKVCCTCKTVHLKPYKIGNIITTLGPEDITY